MAPQSAVPPSLPPSVEEAYRRKCVQLKNRTNEVEDANDAARLRLARIKRQVEKLRIERAFLLEQLAKRTSTNVEDSEGSPSPPPTPKDKPLRIKRGHRKSAVNDADSKAGAAGSFKEPGSPGSEAQSHPPEGQSKGSKSTANGVAKSSKKSVSAFDVYSAEKRPDLEDKNKDGDANIDEDLARDWEELPDDAKSEYRAKAKEQSRELLEKEDSKDAEDSGKKADKDDADVDGDGDGDGDGEGEGEGEGDGEGDGEAEGEGDGEGEDDGKPDTQDEDVEMANYDTEDQETQMDKDGDE
ncbi:hypothetical protein JDV02_000942 [Purpureocillium takamizusanense]|uniref:HMG box domain-containing protein n=1 Tax=Purpureocillium takamizusanense TaxID=2060973 RepID=A0A9Q8V624_9HYPO|nr:uncharacterized protein JDV02_000942 [Purpureocillium takamizusanense]UNI14298.1 hypothetical protein JDV02_000942 [Purpureocillium takamizusanense]